MGVCGLNPITMLLLLPYQVWRLAKVRRSGAPSDGPCA